MSFLLVRGEMLHCFECDNLKTIEYEGGPRSLQIGEMGVFTQLRMNEKYMPSSYEPKVYGYYIHREAYCGRCIFKKENTVILNDNKFYSNLLTLGNDLINKTTEILDNKADELVSQIADDEIVETIKEAVKSIESTRDNALINKSELIDLRSQYCKKALLGATCKNPEIKEVVKLLKNSIMEFKSCHHKEIMNYFQDKNVFIKIDTSEVRQLNPYVSYELTKAKPIIIEDDSKFYDEVENISEAIKEYFSYFEKMSNKLENTLKNKINKKLENFIEFLKSRQIDEKLLLEANEEYSVQLKIPCGGEPNPNGLDIIIACNECGRKFIRQDKILSEQDPFILYPYENYEWLELSNGIYEIIKQNTAQYNECICNECYGKITERQNKNPEYERIISELGNLFKLYEEYSREINKSVKESYREFISLFAKTDAQSLNSEEFERIRNQEEWAAFLVRYETKITNNMKSYVRAQCRRQAISKVDELNKNLRNIKERIDSIDNPYLGIYQFYQKEKINRLKINEYEYIPYKIFYHILNLPEFKFELEGNPKYIQKFFMKLQGRDFTEIAGE